MNSIQADGHYFLYFLIKQFFFSIHNQPKKKKGEDKNLDKNFPANSFFISPKESLKGGKKNDANQSKEKQKNKKKKREMK